MENLADLTPTFSVTVLHCPPDTDEAAAFRSLVAFLRASLEDPGRARSVRSIGDVLLGESDQIPGLGSLLDLGVDGVFAAVRERSATPAWSGGDALDVVNQLTLALRYGPYALLHTPVSDEALRKWLRTYNKLYRYLPSATLRGTFHGDGKTVWLRGVGRRRVNRPDNKTLGGLRIQEVLDDEDAAFALSAVTIDQVPADEAAIVRGRVTVSHARSRLFWKCRVDMATFLAAAAETVAVLDKALAGEQPEELFPQLAVPETELANVFGAYDVSVADEDDFADLPDPDGELADRAALLRTAFLDIRGRADSPAFTAVVGRDGAEVGELAITPVARGDRFDLDVRFAGTPSCEAMAREIRDAIGDGDLLRVYYESGHTFDEHQINFQNQTAPPFHHLEFADFGPYAVTKEKPDQQPIHDAIGENGDLSLFAWVVQRYTTGWLVCDDGAGEAADFLHLENGTLTAIHVKAAHNASPNRHVAVTAYEEVVAQAVKNLRLLATESLIDRFTTPRLARHAAWFNGVRETDLAGFVTALAARTTRDKTQVVIVQPHLRRTVHDAARAAADACTPTRESRSLTLLDGLLRTARRAVIALWDDLTVIGSE